MSIGSLLNIVYLSITGQIPADPSWDKVRSELITRLDELDWNGITEDGYILMDRYFEPNNISIVAKVAGSDYSIMVSDDIVYNMDSGSFNSTDATDLIITKLQTILI